jgi:hypothetical protein
MRSLLKCAIFSNNRKSSKTTGPRGPTVSEFWLSPTGLPASVVIVFFFSSAIISSHFSPLERAGISSGFSDYRLALL